MTKRRKRLLLIGGVLGVAAISVAMVLSALSSTVAYFYTPTDLQKLASPPQGVIRIGGLVEPGSVSFAPGEETIVTFVVGDTTAKAPVSYKGVLPDLFRDGQGVVVQGTLKDGVIIANEVLAKHDENYMPKEVADALKEQGRWKDDQTQ